MDFQTYGVIMDNSQTIYLLIDLYNWALNFIQSFYEKRNISKWSLISQLIVK